MLDPARSYGLPPFLTEDAGVNSGVMLAHYTQAAMVAENRRLAVPASTDSLPTSAMQEDHVSMGWGAARKLRTVVANLGRILAVELTCAARALDLRAPLEPGPGTAAARAAVRAVVPGAGSGPLARAGAGRGRGARGVGRGARRRRGRDREPRVSARTVHAPRGAELSCRGWGQEAALRMLMNNLDPDVAEHPDELVVYGGTGKAARSWEAFDALVRTLRTLADDETMLVQSGKPVGVFRTHEWAPRVLIANSNLVGEWATWDEFRRLEALGLTMYGQMTAGSWIYIGSQGIVQGTYECFAEIARRRFGGSLAGTITLTAGLGGMGGAQPLAVTMNEGVALCVEVDRDRIRRRLETRYLDEEADDLADAVERCLRAKRERRPLSVGLCANAAEVLPELLRQGFEADVVTDQTSAHDPLVGYVPADLTLPEADALRRDDPDEYIRRARVSAAAHCFAMVGFMDARRRGLRLRQQPARRGQAGRLRARLRLSRLRARLHTPAVLRGARARSAGSRCRATRRTSPPPTAPCSTSSPRTRASRAGSAWRASASPSRGCRRGSAGSATGSAGASDCASTRWLRAAS